MLVSLLLLLLTSNALTTDLNKSILYSRISILGLLSLSSIVYSNIFIDCLESGLTLYNGLFTINILSQSFSLFILILTSIISTLSAFFSRKNYYNNEPKISNYLLSENNNKGTVLNNELSESDNKETAEKIELEDKKNTIYLNKNHLQFTILEYALIILFVVCGAIFLISVSDLVSLFLSIELQSYGLYIIATIYRNSESATGSGLTYFLLGGLSSCFILLGSAILYVNSGITNLDNIYILNSINEFSTSNNTLNYINFSFIILSVGLLFKISAAPFHFWSPDVYDGIPTIVTTFVAIIAKISLLVLMLNLVIHSDVSSSNIIYQDTEFSQDPYNIASITKSDWKNVLILSSLMSLIIGSILGLTQYRIKRLFAYSTISHIGFILLALCINKIESIQAYIFYILQYSVSNLNAFFILITIGYTLYRHKYTSNTDKTSNGVVVNSKNFGDNKHKKDKYIDIENSPIQLLSQIKGYFYINVFLSLSFAITLFSFVGIPPLIGFFAKQMILSSALDEGYIFMTLVAVITSVIAAAYYLNIIKLIFFSKSDYVSEFIIKQDNDITSHKNLDGLQINKSSGNNIFLNDKLSIIISTLTMFILLFIFMPDEWFRIVNIISISINKS